MDVTGPSQNIFMKNSAAGGHISDELISSDDEDAE